MSRRSLRVAFLALLVAPWLLELFRVRPKRLFRDQTDEFLLSPAGAPRIEQRDLQHESRTAGPKEAHQEQRDDLTCLRSPPTEGGLTFERTVNGEGPYIFKMKANGKIGKTLTNNADGMVDNKDPAWSPNGRKIVFSSDRDDPDSLYVMKARRLGRAAAHRSRQNSTTIPNPAGRRTGARSFSYTKFDSGPPEHAIALLTPMGRERTALPMRFSRTS